MPILGCALCLLLAGLLINREIHRRRENTRRMNRDLAAWVRSQTDEEYFYSRYRRDQKG